MSEVQLAQKERVEELYTNQKFSAAIDWWTAPTAQDSLDVAISNARHLDPTRQTIENEVWRRSVPAGSRVLDLACGRGFFSQRLRDALDGDVDIVGLDLSETIFRRARSEHSVLSGVVADGKRLPFSDQAFDAVLLISSLELMPNPKAVVTETYRTLRDGGYLYLCLHKPSWDPLLLPGAMGKSLSLMKDRSRLLATQLSNLRRPQPVNHSDGNRSLRELRRSLPTWLSSLGYEFVESRALVPRFHWHTYRKLAPAAIPRLIRVGHMLNRLPFSYYKDLEYWLWRKL